MHNTLKLIGFCLFSALIFASELYGIVQAMLWAFPPESWWQVPVFIFLVIMGLVAGFFILWMLSHVFWEVENLQKNKKAGKKRVKRI